MRKIVLVLLTAACLGGISARSAADVDGERAALARLVHELALLTEIITEAEAQADVSRRVRFQYQWLRQDLARVRQGIEEHIQGVRIEPRKIKPLKGDYRR